MRPRIAIIAVVLITAVAWLWPRGHSDRAGWIDDYHTLREHTVRAYANLGERLRTRNISPRELDRKIEKALGEAKNPEEARAALQAFAAAFDDNHFKVRRAASPVLETGSSSVTPQLSGAEACARLGYDAPDRGELAWSSLSGWRETGGGTAERPFPAGVVVEEDRPPLAILRIPAFGGENYPALCAAEWEKYRTRLDGACDPGCEGDFALAVELAMIDRLAFQVEELARAGARALAIDLTGNGGGSSVASPLARQLTPIPLKEAEVGFIRHAHWEKRFRAARDAFIEELKRADLPPEQRALLEDARARAEAMRIEATRSCDLSGIWTQRSAELACDPLGRFSGFVRYARPGELDGLASKKWLFSPSQYAYREGVWTGALYVLVDRWTASAAEGFASMLEDNDAAILLGEKTFGSGCGYTGGGVTIPLSRTGLTARAPDCVRYRKNGRSEAEGVTPRLIVPWDRSDDPAARALKALAVLRSIQ
jgi:hypothetical protein